MGLKYNSSEAQELIDAMTNNLNISKEAATGLNSGAQYLTSALTGGNLQGAAYNAGKQLFEGLIIPTISKTSEAIDDMHSDLELFKQANGQVSHYGVLDEDNLNNQINEKKRQRDATSFLIEQNSLYLLTNPAVGLVEYITGANSQLENLLGSIEDDINELEEKLKALHNFSDSTSHLFRDDSSVMKDVMKGVTVLNKTILNSDGTLPPGTDVSWFMDLEAVELSSSLSKPNSAYDAALSKIITYDKDGLIKSVNFEEAEKWMKSGKLTQAQIEALKTLYLTLPGYLDKITDSEDTVNSILIEIQKLQEKYTSCILGFKYDYKNKHFYTTQNSLQSHFGYTDFYEQCGPAFGMDLNTSQVQFVYNGKEYRFQIWKGTYGGGTTVGGEQGLYVWNPKDPVQDGEKAVATRLGQGNFDPVAVPDDQIRMVNELHNKTTSKLITVPSDTKRYERKGAYWNLDTVSKPGYTKDNVYTQGALYIKNTGLRNKMYSELKANIDFEDVKIEENRVTYIWGK